MSRVRSKGPMGYRPPPPPAPPTSHVDVTDVEVAPHHDVVAAEATADTWIANDRTTGQKRAVKVVDMSSGHLVRWVQYFRRKYEHQGVTRATVDHLIQSVYVTAPAIYAEIDKRGLRGLIDPTVAPPTSAPRIADPLPTPTPGHRLITLKDD